MFLDLKFAGKELSPNYSTFLHEPQTITNRMDAAAEPATTKWGVGNGGGPGAAPEKFLAPRP